MTDATAKQEESKEAESSFYDDPENLKKLCDFLRSRQGPAIREALLMEKRVHYLKGEFVAVRNIHYGEI
jgi:hypothetical protein